MHSQVIAQLTYPGYHQYPGAPEQVKFLEYKHRHEFIIKVGYNVTDLNREVEIFIERDKIADYLKTKYGYPAMFGSMSCEMIAAELLKSNPAIAWVEVWEEQTGGARVEQ